MLVKAISLSVAGDFLLPQPISKKVVASRKDRDMCNFDLIVLKNNI